MVKRQLLLFLILFLILTKTSPALQVSPHTQFSLLTNTPGRELYTVFGHCAFRMQDTAQNTDIVFNYGTFDFSTPNFYLKFIKGKLNYFLSIETFTQYIWGLNPVQAVYEQVLNLTGQQKKELLDFLMINYLPGNRSYKYDFFYDNCATRLRDALKSIYGKDVNFDFFQPDKQETFRQILDPYISRLPWIDLGINILLGIPADKLAGPMDYLFIPDYVMETFAVSTITKDTINEPLVKKTAVVIEGEQGEGQLNMLSPGFVIWALFIIILLTSIFSIKNNKIRYRIDYFLFGILGLLGCLLLFIWITTDHDALKQNLNILWAFPFHFFILFFLGIKKLDNFVRFYFLGFVILNSIILVCWPFLPQNYHPAVFPIILISSTRSLRIYLYKSANKIKRKKKL